MSPDNGDDSHDTFGPVIFRYTRKMAIEDGTLVDLNKVAPDVCRQHFKHPIAMTAAAFEIIKSAVENPAFVNDYPGVIHDVLWMAIAAGREVDESTRLFEVLIYGAGLNPHKTFKIVCGPGDQAEPVLTIMLPDED